MENTHLEPDGKHNTRAVKYWTSAIKWTAGLLGRTNVSPGTHFAITELVHCKSREAEGFKDAKCQCITRYLDDVLTYSGAKIIICPGKKVEEVIRLKYGICIGKMQAIELFGNKVYFLFPPRAVGHIGRYDNFLTKEELGELRDHLNSDT